MLAGCGGGADEAQRTDKDPFKAVDQNFRTLRSQRAAPRWEPVARLAGREDETRRLAISRRAIQWRVRFTCPSGRIALAVSPPPSNRPARVERPCGKPGTASWITTGDVELAISAPGSWRAVVEQQVDTALHEPPLAAMRSPDAGVVARGPVYTIERKSSGKALLHRLPDGRLALRLEDFQTSANTDLFVWLSEARRPRTTKQAVRAPYKRIGPLKSTVGDQNYLVPRGLEAGRIRSVVIWCAPVAIAYGGAALGRAP